MWYNFEVQYGREEAENHFIITQRSILWIKSYQKDLRACRLQNSHCCGFSGVVSPAHTQSEGVSARGPAAAAVAESQT